MSSPSTSVPPGELVLTGISYNLTDRLRRPLLISLSIGDDSRSVVLNKREQLVGTLPFHSPLNLQDGSTLIVRLEDKHFFRPTRIETRRFSLKDMWPVQLTSLAGKDPTEHQHLSTVDPKKKIWINVVRVEGLNTKNGSLQKLKHFKSDLDSQGRWSNALEKVKSIAGNTTQLRLYAKEVVEGIGAINDELGTQARHEDMLALARSMGQVLMSIPGDQDIVTLNELKDTIETFPDLMRDTADFIEQWSKNKSNFFAAFKNQNEIEELKRRFDQTKEALDRGVAANMLVRAQRTQELEELKMLLGGFREVEPASLECLEGTRTNIIMEIEEELKSSLGHKNIVSIFGAPGSGKSSISLSMRSKLRKRNSLVTYFRFDRNHASITTSRALWCRVAYDLAEKYPSVLKHNLSLLRSDRVDLESAIDVFTCLIKGSLSNLTDTLLNGPNIIVIDGLNECGGILSRSSPDRRALLKTLLVWSELPKQLHFELLVTSREEDDVMRVLTPSSAIIRIPSGHSLSSVPRAARIQVDEDVRVFLQHCFRRIAERSSLPADWPGAKTVDDMVQRAAGNFMWVVAATNFIDSGLDPDLSLENLMGPESPSGFGPLYSLYSTILETSFGNMVEGSEMEVLRAVLGSTVVSKRPLTDEEYTKLPTPRPITSSMLRSIRNGLGSVIVPNSELRFIHKSFDDFLLSDTCPPKYRVKVGESQYLMAIFCIMTMKAGLRFNICDLETSYSRNADVRGIEVKVEIGISRTLAYSCRYWAEHCSRTPLDSELMVEVKEIIYDKLLYWFESMSLLKEMDRVSHSLQLVLDWSKSTEDGDFTDFIRDARRFVAAFIYPITQSAPHVYISALPFAPDRSLLARHFLPQYPHILALSSGKQLDWSSCIFTSEYHKDRISSVAFSPPDEKFFISGSDDQTICICDSETGSLVVGPLRASDRVLGTFFSPDGRRVWAYFEDGRVTGLDPKTGDQLLTLTVGDNRNVIGCRCLNDGNIVAVTRKPATVALWSAKTGERLVQEQFELPISDEDFIFSISPDGVYMAWARDNKAIRIRKLVDGSEIKDLLDIQGHDGKISALSFAVDGRYVVSGSENGSILVWDASTGETVGRPLVTGKGALSAVAYSHHNSTLVSASGRAGMMMVWNASTHEAILGPLEGHTSEITEIALSRDGRRALSASWDGTVRMWDLVVRGISSPKHTTNGHLDRVKCVAFSPCGKKIASLGNDATIRVWDAQTLEPLLNPIPLDSLYSDIVFSHDGTEIGVFGTGALMIWSANTGEIVFQRDLGSRDKDGRQYFAFRSSDGRLVTCSAKGVVCVWSPGRDVTTEEYSVPSPQSETAGERVEILALSPNGSTILLSDKNKHHYLSSTTTRQTLDLTIHDIDKAVFSPSGNFLAVASADAQSKGTLHVWSTQTGELTTGPSTLAEKLYCLAFSSDDCHIAFVYHDSTSIWVWNTRTDRLASGPWQGHVTAVTTLAFSVDGRKLVSGSEDGQIRIWDAADLVEESQSSIRDVTNGTRMEDGWVMTEDAKLLFWVPKDHRAALLWGRAKAVTGGGGIPTRLDMTEFRYGENWMECREMDE